MTLRMLRRLHTRHEEGYALVIAILLLAIMMVLLVVTLDAGNSALRQTSRGGEWSKALTIAEGGVNDMVTRLGTSRSATSPCAIGTATVCSGGGGQYQVKWTQSGAQTIVTAIGYYPSRAAPRFAREVQVTYEPVPSFRYAIFSQAALEVKNGIKVRGDVYSDGDITIGTGAVVCGSVLSSGGSIELQNGSQVVKTEATLNCSGKAGRVWSGGAGGIVGSSTVVVQGDAKASAPASVTCASNLSSYNIDSSVGTFTVQGTATACGKISGVSGAVSTSPGTATSQPAPVSFPTYTFDPANYPSIVCYPAGDCGTSDSDTAYSEFQTFVNANRSALTGTFAVFQRSPSQSTVIDLSDITLAGDFTLITNAPVTLGNTGLISTTTASSDFSLIDLYVPPTSSACDENGGDCSIYAKNNVQFDSGLPTDDNDGVVGLLYTIGKMAFKNQGNEGEGALYATGMDIKNGYEVQYNSRIERTLGFGQTLQQVLWQEINCPSAVCPG